MYQNLSKKTYNCNNKFKKLNVILFIIAVTINIMNIIIIIKMFNVLLLRLVKPDNSSPIIILLNTYHIHLNYK